MRRAGAIDDTQLATAKSSAIIVASGVAPRFAPYFCDYIASQVERFRHRLDYWSKRQYELEKH